MSFEELLLEERKNDQGLKKSKQNTYEPGKLEEDGLKHDGPTGPYISLTGEKKVDVSPKNKKSQTWKKRLDLKRRWGLIRCGGPNRRVRERCPALLIVKCGQKTKICHRCGHRRTLANKKPYAQSDSQKKLRVVKKRMEQSGDYSFLGDLDV